MDRFEEFLHFNSGLSFFGKISASISHELKNSLAILNENSGLLSDMILMQEKGMPLNMERLAKLNRDLEKQIDRSNNIINNFNFFSHSADEKINEISFSEFSSKYIALTERLYIQKSIQAKSETSAENVVLKTSEFALLMLLWHIIDVMNTSIDQDISVIIGAFAGKLSGCVIKCEQLNKYAFENIKKSVIINSILSGMNAGIEIENSNIIIQINDLQE